MSRKCTVCSHPDFLEINQKLASPGVVYSELAQPFNLGRKAVERRARHYFDRLKARGIGDVYARGEIEKLFARIDSLQSEVDELRLRLEPAQIVQAPLQTSLAEETTTPPSETVLPAVPEDVRIAALLKHFREKREAEEKAKQTHPIFWQLS